MKQYLFALTKSSLFESFIALLDKLDKGSLDLLRVLTYHRVDKPEDSMHLSPTLLSATPEMFTQQMAFLRRHYNPVSVQQVLDYIEQKKPLPPRALLVTVDDAYCDVEKYIWPIAKQHDIPLVLFVPTDYPDNPKRSLWWDMLYNGLIRSKQEKLDTAFGSFLLTNLQERIKAFKCLCRIVKSLPHEDAMALVGSIHADLAVPACENSILGWEALRRLATEGLMLAPHSCSHPMLDRISLEAVRSEISQSRIVLQEKIGQILPIFAYPSGQVSEGVLQVLKEEGFRLAFTTERGVNKLTKQNPLLLKRINVGQSTTIAMIRAQCLASLSKLGEH